MGDLVDSEFDPPAEQCYALHEELVEIALADRKKSETIEEWTLLVLGLRQYPLG